MFYLTKKTMYSLEDQEMNSKNVSKATFSKKLKKFVKNKGGYSFMFISVKKGKVKDICLSYYEPQL